MSQHKARVFARFFGYQMPASLPAGQMQITVEWKLLGGTREGGKTTFTISDLTTDQHLSEDLREALADHLSVKFSTTFRPRDIIGYSI